MSSIGGSKPRKQTIYVTPWCAGSRTASSSSDTLTAMGNLASTHHELGHHGQALEIGVQVLEGLRRILGDEHPDTLTAMANLASTHRALGHHEQALEIEVQVLEHRRRILGDQHPDTMRAKSNLATIESELEAS